MIYHNKHDAISLAGIGSVQFWDDDNPVGQQCIVDAVNNYGVTLIDTAEMYADGLCETRISNALRRLDRNSYYLVGKVLPYNVNGGQLRKHLTDSLARLNQDYFDLYLLHWRLNADLNELVSQMEETRKEGLIVNWGVSNFDMKDMADLLAIPGSENCFCNQILYNIQVRGPEYDLLPFLREKGIMPMAYSSLGNKYYSREVVRNNPAIKQICRENGITAEALSLSFVTRYHDIPALFSTSSVKHLADNLAFADFDIMPYMDIIDREFPAPDHAVALAKI